MVGRDPVHLRRRFTRTPASSSCLTLEGDRSGRRGSCPRAARRCIRARARGVQRPAGRRIRVDADVVDPGRNFSSIRNQPSSSTSPATAADGPAWSWSPVRLAGEGAPGRLTDFGVASPPRRMAREPEPPARDRSWRRTSGGRCPRVGQMKAVAAIENAPRSSNPRAARG